MSLQAASAVGTGHAPDECAQILSLRGVHAVAVATGHDDGRLALEAVLQAIRLAAPALRVLADEADRDPDKRLAVLAQMERLFDRITRTLHREGLGTAGASVAVERGSRLFVGHVGNTRIDLRRGAQWARITLDHSVAAERLRLGELTAEEAEASPERHVLYQALGRVPAVRPDVLELHLADSDRLVLSTPDLLTRAGRDRLDAAEDLQSAADSLVQGASAAAAVLVLVHHPDAPQAQAPAAPWPLDGIALFDGFDDAARRRLAPYLREVELRAGQQLFREGDEADELFAVVDGRLVVTSESVQLTTLAPGDHVGDIGLTLGGTRTATVKAQLPSRLVGLSRGRLNSLLRARPELAALFMQALVEALALRVDDLTGRLVEKSWTR